MHASYVLRIRTISRADGLHVGFLRAFFQTAARDRFEGAFFASFFSWVSKHFLGAWNRLWVRRQLSLDVAMVRKNNRQNDGNNAAKL